MASSSPLPLLLVLLLASSWAAVARARPGDNVWKHTVVYMHERLTGPNATRLITVQSPLGGDNFGQFGVVDNELRDGPDPLRSSLCGRFQALFALAGLVSPPGMQSAVNFLFTAGRFRGSTVSVLGPILDFKSTCERSIVGGTGVFRMARGYSFMRLVPEMSIPDKYSVYKLDLFVQLSSDRPPLLPPVDSVGAYDILI
ncbi:hypothetical protein CFC21_063652 [Triticum aestivum]|uniref:Dirigent protein n=2 Tax=Triticum aestivum TaxID=4565 RepID=A0A3B6JP65_WHEAT|nr:hypothetical protein CFC21_063652 [Triticum aestivum]